MLKERLFQFPSNGKAYPKVEVFARAETSPLSFNSLQTGKHIQRRTPERSAGTQSRFQFPSNGKPYPKSKNSRTRYTSNMILFQFPSNGKAYPKSMASLHPSPLHSFNSLQTGKHIQSEELNLRNEDFHKFQFPSNGKAYPKEADLLQLTEEYLACFNSLQTGKHIQRASTTVDERDDIAFQFPSNGKAYPKAFFDIALWSIEVWKFQFPSNGKAYPKGRNEEYNCHNNQVSIPFKRESISKVPPSSSHAGVNLPVSIPFKRESISKVDVELGDLKPDQVFQFPSNGKAYPKTSTGMVRYELDRLVSIPFKRETISKVVVRVWPLQSVFLQFQFPSNGKAYPKFTCAFSDVRR